MKLLSTSIALVMMLFASFIACADFARADGWMIQGPVVYRSYYAAAPVTYHHACTAIPAHTAYYAPRRYAPQNSAPQTYSQTNSQLPYNSPQARVPALPPQRPTTTAMVVAFDNYYEPKTINVQPGTTLRWLNRGKHAHTVTAEDDSWDSGDIAPGASYTATFQRPGTYYYYCRHHTDDKMRGTIVVGSGGQGGYAGAAREGAGGSRTRGYGGGLQRNGDPPRSNGAAAGRSGY
jgi:plastocyanin